MRAEQRKRSMRKDLKTLPGLRRWLVVVAASLLTVLGCGNDAASTRNAAPASIPAKQDDKLVFAHYFPPYPISIDNRPTDQDYYATKYLDPAGAGGADVAFGGTLRDRPLPRDPRPESDWRLRDLEDEVRQATSVGIDEFTL